MEVRMENKKAAVLTGVEPVLAAIQLRLQTRPKDWLQKLHQNPGSWATSKKKSIVPLRKWRIKSWPDCSRKQPPTPISPRPLKKSSSRRSGAQIANRRTAIAAGAAFGRLAAVGDDAVLQSRVANRQAAVKARDCIRNGAFCTSKKARAPRWCANWVGWRR